VTVPAFSETTFTVLASAIKSENISSGDGIATGSVHFSVCHDLHPYLNAVTKCDKNRRVKVGAMNTTADAIVIPAGTKYGSFSRIIEIAHHSEHPFCVAVIDSANRLHHLDQDERNNREKKKKKKKKTAHSSKWVRIEGGLPPFCLKKGGTPHPFASSHSMPSMSRPCSITAPLLPRTT
jgi:hypothetical protein